MNKLSEQPKRRITLLYLIYRESWGDTTFPVSLNNIRYGTDQLMGKSPNYLSKSARYLLSERWISLRNNYEAIVFITHEGIKQAERWEQDYSLDQRIELDQLYEESLHETQQNLAGYLGIELENFHRIERPRFLINWIKNTSNESHSQPVHIHLYENLKQSFDESEIKTLCFRLNIEYEDLAGSTRAEKIRELLKWVHRRQETDRLIKELECLRPKINWKDSNFQENGKTN